MKLCSSLFVVNKASCLENKESRNMNNDKDLKFFGGYRHLGYLNKKPLIAKYILEKDNFEISLNHNILDKEYAGKFNNKLMNADLQLFTESRISVPMKFNKLLKTAVVPKKLNGRTTVSTIAWIASLIEIANMKSELAYVKGNVSKHFLFHVANAIFTSAVAYVENNKDHINFRNAGRILGVKDNKHVNDFRLDNLLKSHLYEKFDKQIKSIPNVESVTEVNKTLSAA